MYFLKISRTSPSATLVCTATREGAASVPPWTSSPSVPMETSWTSLTTWDQNFTPWLGFARNQWRRRRWRCKDVENGLKQLLMLFCKFGRFWAWKRLNNGWSFYYYSGGDLASVGQILGFLGGSLCQRKWVRAVNLLFVLFLKWKHFIKTNSAPAQWAQSSLYMVFQSGGLSEALDGIFWSRVG